MAKVMPTVLLRGLPCASFKVPANLIRRGTANVGTSSLGACAVRLGDSGTAVTGPRPCLEASSSDTGRCCPCAPATHRKNTKPNRDHLAVRFMGPLLSSQAEGIKIFSGSGPRRRAKRGQSKKSWAMAHEIGRDSKLSDSNCQEEDIRFVVGTRYARLT